jgi:hypothetical protein
VPVFETGEACALDRRPVSRMAATIGGVLSVSVMRGMQTRKPSSQNGRCGPHEPASKMG